MPKNQNLTYQLLEFDFVPRLNKLCKQHPCINKEQLS